MLGWLVAKSKNKTSFSIPSELSNCVHTIDDGLVIYNCLNKFQNDKGLFDFEAGFFLSDGVLMNLSELKAYHNAKNIEDLIKNTIQGNITEFLLQFNGSYNGTFQKEGSTYVFTNRIGDKSVFYYNDEDAFAASSNLNMLFDFCKLNGYKLSINDDAAFVLLNNFFMLDDRTLVNEISRVMPGYFIEYKNNTATLKRYYDFENTKFNNDTQEEIIENVDKLFRQAVKRCYDKNIEYGYRQFADLSAGLDSRMVSWVAYDMGYKDVTNICFGAIGNDEQGPAMQMAADMKNQFIFKSLEDMEYMYNIDELTEHNYALSYYAGPTAAYSFTKLLNPETVGLKHSGQTTAALSGMYLSKNGHEPVPIIKSMPGKGNLDKEIKTDIYKNKEQYLLCSRSILGGMNSFNLQNEFWIMDTPFTDNDFFSYCLSIPPEYRYDFKLYLKWIKEKYPEAAKYKWTNTGASLKYNVKLMHTLLWVKNHSRRTLNRIFNKLHLRKNKYTRIGMNPLDYMIEQSPKTQQFMNDYFNNSYKSNLSEQLIKTMNNKMKGNFQEKTSCLTILSFNNQHFREG